MLRRQFDNWAPAGSPLRKLAAEIAQLDASVWPTFLSRAGREPPNVLANAESSSKWTPPLDYSRKAVLKWKGNPAALHGFASKSRKSTKGLALLFDPFVDAFLAAHFANRAAIPSDCTVLVLTDFYPSVSAGYPAEDWAKNETREILAGNVNGRHSTATQLFDSLFGKAEWRGQGEKIVKGISDKKLLLWNFFPMFRGGDIPTGSSGLPMAGNWRLRCWELLSEFLVAVGASRAVLASSQAMLPVIRSTATALSQMDLDVPGVDSLLPLLPCSQGIYRISHPSSWKRVHNDGPHLNALLAS
jgi:hypothetical protein